MICKICGCEFEKKWSRQTMCGPECSRIAKSKWQTEYERRKREKAKEQRTENKKAEEARGKRSDLINTAVAARAAGRTYGQHVANEHAKRNRIIRKEFGWQMDEKAFKEKMKADGWHNVYNENPTDPGEYRVYRRNGSTGRAQYLGKGRWHDGRSGWEIIWWK